MNDPAPPEATDWHLREADDEAARRAEVRGANEPVARVRGSPWRLRLEQFTDIDVCGAGLFDGQPAADSEDLSPPPSRGDAAGGGPAVGSV